MDFAQKCVHKQYTYSVDWDADIFIMAFGSMNFIGTTTSFVHDYTHVERRTYAVTDNICMQQMSNNTLARPQMMTIINIDVCLKSLSKLESQYSFDSIRL